MKRWLVIGLFMSGAASFATTDAQVRKQASTFVSEARAAVSDFVARQGGGGDGDDGAIARSSAPGGAASREDVASDRTNAAAVSSGIARVTLKPVSSPSSAATLEATSTEARARSIRGTPGVVLRPVRRDRERPERDVASAPRSDAVVRAFSRAQVAVVEIREPSIARESLAPPQDLSPRELLPNEGVTTVEQEAVRPSSPAEADEDEPEQATSDEAEDATATRRAVPVVPSVSKAGAARRAARARLLRERRARQQRARQKKARQRAAAKRRARVRANARKRRRAQNRARSRARARRAARSSRARRPLVKIKRKCFRYGGCDTYVSFRRPRTRAEAARLSRIRNRIIAERLRRRRFAY